MHCCTCRPVPSVQPLSSTSVSLTLLPHRQVLFFGAGAWGCWGCWACWGCWGCWACWGSSRCLFWPMLIVWCLFVGSLLSLHSALHAKSISILLSFNRKLKSADFSFFARGWIREGRLGGFIGRTGFGPFGGYPGWGQEGPGGSRGAQDRAQWGA